MRKFIYFISILSLLATIHGEVTVTEKQLLIPTYEVGQPDPNPYFFQGQRYQGASRRVYPYPMVDDFSDNLIDKHYTAVILENEYVEICVLPELGGKLYYAKDKTNDYYFMYRNQVVEPALIGMTGAWTSGGIEWNVPHHHRATSFSMVDYLIEEGDDGSKTVWVGETEMRDNMKWTVGLTLYPGNAIVETTARVMNTTPEKNSMLFWANASTHANEDYQVIFPPLTQYATFHKKNQFTEWPISRQIYTRGDYRKGVDVSLWKNHFVSSSWFAWETQSNFVAGYDHGKKAGTVLYGNPHTNPGAKLWSWGNNESGMLWSDILTDEDGPYVELMFGAFSDNQPDYSWLHPYETKESLMYFMPSRDIPSVKKVNGNGFLDLQATGGKVRIGVYAAKKLTDAQIVLKQGGTTVYNDRANISPDNAYSHTLELKSNSSELLSLSLLDSNGDTLIEYTALPKPDNPMPKAVTSPKKPEELSAADDLYFVGLRFEQFHEPQIDSMDYYMRALELEPAHVKSNLQVGKNYFRRRMYDEAEDYISKAVKLVTRDYTIAEDAEGLYYAGLIQLRKGKTDEAYKLLYRASWDHEWAAASHYQLALIKLHTNDLESGLIHLDESLTTNQRNIDALSTKVTVLRNLGKAKDALLVVEKILQIHPLNFRALHEQSKLQKKSLSKDVLARVAASGLHTYLDTATKYGSEGFLAEALEILDLFKNSDMAESPIVHYLSGYYQSKLGDNEQSLTSIDAGVSLPVDGCFPSRIETQKALEWALSKNEDPKTLLYLGNLLYEMQPKVATELWKKAAASDSDISVIHRNLAFAYAHSIKDYKKAVKHIKSAITLNDTDPLYFTEQDAYMSKTNAPVAERLRLMEKNLDTVLRMNHTTSAYLRLLVLNSRYDQAMELAENYHFRKWEGDEERAYEYWVYTHLVTAAREIQAGKLQEARKTLEKSISRPKNIDVPIASLDMIVHYHLGVVKELLGNKAEAKAAYEKVLKGVRSENDIKLFAGMAYQKLGQQDKADAIFEELIEKGNLLLEVNEEPDFFDPFASLSRKLSDDENLSRANYMLALGNFGKGDKKEAAKLAKKAVELNRSLVAITFRLEGLL